MRFVSTFQDFHGQQSLNDVLATMTNAVTEMQVAHVVLDNLQFMIGCDSGPRYSRMTRFEYQDVVVAAFRQFATNSNCHVTLVIHPRKEVGDELTNNSVFGGGKATQEADNILILQKKSTGPFRTKKYIQITKNRFDGDLGIVPLTFDKQSLSFGAKPGQDAKQDRKTLFDITFPPAAHFAES